MNDEHRITDAANQAQTSAALKLAALAESTSDAIIGLAVDGTIDSWNIGAKALYGYTTAEAVGRNISMLAPKGAEDEFPAKILRIKAGERLVNFETTQIRKYGQTQVVALTMSPLLDEYGTISGVATIARDITSQKRTHDALRALSNMEATTLLAGGVAHDLNNLMAAVLGHAELLAMEFRDRPAAMGSVDVILGSAQLAGRLAQELLAFAQGGRYESAVVNMNKIVQQVLGLQIAHVPQGVTIKQELAADLNSVVADPTQMAHALHNLIKNAIEAVDGQGRILIKTCNAVLTEQTVAEHGGLRPGQHVVVTVSDSGHGMSEDVVANAFKPFYSTKGLGRGLGLAAVYGISKNHGGHVTASSPPGKGAVVTIYLPSTTRESIEIPVVPSGELRGSETILVVDDEAQLLMLNRRILEANGYHVLTARDGAEALRVSEEFAGDIHLVVLDMAMPVMDGAKAFALLKQARPDCKVIISSGYDLNDKVRSLLVAGADAFLQKPFRLTDLTSEVRRLLNSQQVDES